MGLVASSQRNLGDVHGAHPQFSPRALHPHPVDIAGNVFAYTGCENAMQVGHRETSDCGQHLPVERLVDVLADILLDMLDAFVMTWNVLWFSHHSGIIAQQNARSLFQMYHVWSGLCDLSNWLLCRRLIQ